VLLAVRALGLGDLLVAVPALRALRRAFPGHRVVLAAPGGLAPLVELTGTVDALRACEWLDESGLALPLTRVEVAVNLHGRGPQSTAMLDALAPARRIGHACGGWSGPRWVEDVPERRRWCELLRWHGIPADESDLLLDAPTTASPAPGAAVIHPGAAYGSKRWPADRFAAVARSLAAEGLPVVVTGSPDERGIAEAVAAAAGLPPDAVLAGRTGLDELAALVQDAAVVVCGDTGVAHLASAYRTPSVVLFGPVPAWRWGPPADGPHLALSDDAHRTGAPFAAEPDAALLGVTVPAVLSAVSRVLARPRQVRHG
jgi:ADP-heptose:LPS heptosyltransferase